MKRATRAQPRLWGTSVVGFGAYHYKYASGREGDWFPVGFSPRKQDLTLYIMPGLHCFPDLLHRLGKYSAGKGCLCVKRLSDLDPKVLEQSILQSGAVLEEMAKPSKAVASAGKPHPRSRPAKGTKRTVQDPRGRRNG